jgi:Ca2+-binding RTX toxin-like protein
MIGVSLYAGQFGTGGTYGQTYVYPGNSYLDYYASRGMDLVRIPFDWERVQPVKDGPLSTTELGRLDAIVDHAKTVGLKVVLDPHNFGYGFGAMIGGGTSNASFADFWGKMAAHFKDDSNVIFGMMNEPHDQTATQWIQSANAAMAAIRNAGATQLVLVPGTYWDGAYSWVNGAYDRPNSDDNDTVVGQGVIDPLNNYAFEVHSYFDAKNSGTGPIVSEDKGINNLLDITNWAEQTGHKLFLGEFGVEPTNLGLRALDDMLAYMDEHPVWMGAAYWAGGPWIGDYRFSIEPNTWDANGNPIDRAQMPVLQRYDFDPTTNPPHPTDLAAAINSGGGVYTDPYRMFDYAADGTAGLVTLTGISRVQTKDAFIVATKLDPLYESVRYGKDFGYDLNVGNGTYTVEFQFSEPYWGTAGSRIFDVLMEGKEVVSNLDVYAAAGDKNMAYDLARTATVTDGVLSIRFDATGLDDKDNAIVSAIVVHKIDGSTPTMNEIKGTDAAETLNGTAGADHIWGYGGNDILNGNGGNDIIEGGLGADKINGNAGADTMQGGPGNDIYFVDNAGDKVIELAGEGTDIVNSDISFTLSDNVENLVLRTSAATDGTGNALNNRLEGNSAGNSLSGLDGNDTILGKGGNDLLTGGAGADNFLFDTAPNAVTNMDRITDFAHGVDHIQLENAVFTALPTTGTLSAAAFQLGSAATEADDRIIYNAGTGALFYDPDGNGAAAQVQFASVSVGTNLTNADVVIV